MKIRTIFRPFLQLWFKDGGKLLLSGGKKTVQGNLNNLQKIFEVEWDNLADGHESVKSELEMVNLARFIVSLPKMMELKGSACTHTMEDGSLCSNLLTFNSSTKGSVCFLTGTCAIGHNGSWKSSEILTSNRNSNVYVNDLISMASILISGNNFTKVSLLFQFLNLQIPKESTFSRV